ncbi:endolysin [Arthrobacter phage Kuleana]|uniref:Endolysin n=1 Tax=Arthrobacter phage Kuleana TaxID=2653270 RepID=A0A5Q2WE31_9CAUD|nr:endolysin [Arthrobacter phage Kuleana]QGH74510.1 endolysin [Arthrobacter phage Kuleana]
MKLANLAVALRKHGLTVVETPGWRSRGFLGRDLLEVRGVLWHHTATNRARFVGNDAPTLSMCIDGRPDVAGPLCNIVFGRNGTVYLTAAGLANHAGAGAWHNIPRDLGNYYLIGIEMESSGVAPWDWTADQLRVAPYLGAALELEYLGHLPPELRLQIGHLEYSSQGKIDPAGWPGGMDGLRAQINKVLAGGGGGVEQEGDFDVAQFDELMEKLNKIDKTTYNTWAGVWDGGSHKGQKFNYGILPIVAHSQNLEAQNAAIIKNLLGALTAAVKGEAFDEDKLLAGVQASAEAGVKAAIESIKTTVHLAPAVEEEEAGDDGQA